MPRENPAEHLGGAAAGTFTGTWLIRIGLGVLEFNEDKRWVLFERYGYTHIDGSKQSTDTGKHRTSVCERTSTMIIEKEKRK